MGFFSAIAKGLRKVGNLVCWSAKKVGSAVHTTARWCVGQNIIDEGDQILENLRQYAQMKHLSLQEMIGATQAQEHRLMLSLEQRVKNAVEYQFPRFKRLTSQFAEWNVYTRDMPKIHLPANIETAFDVGLVDRGMNCASKVALLGVVAFLAGGIGAAFAIWKMRKEAKKYLLKCKDEDKKVREKIDEAFTQATQYQRAVDCLQAYIDKVSDITELYDLILRELEFLLITARTPIVLSHPERSLKKLPIYGLTQDQIALLMAADALTRVLAKVCSYSPCSEEETTKYANSLNQDLQDFRNNYLCA